MEIEEKRILKKKKDYWKLSDIMDYLSEEEREKAYIRGVGKVSVNREVEYVK